MLTNHPADFYTSPHEYLYNTLPALAVRSIEPGLRAREDAFMPTLNKRQAAMFREVSDLLVREAAEIQGATIDYLSRPNGRLGYTPDPYTSPYDYMFQVLPQLATSETEPKLRALEDAFMATLDDEQAAMFRRISDLLVREAAEIQGATIDYLTKS